MKKFWRSGMIDKKIVKEREQEEYINRLHRVILELRKQPPEPKPCCVKRRNGIPYVPVELSHKDRDDYWLAQHRRDVGCNPLKPHTTINFADNWDEIRQGDNITLEFGEAQILTAPRESLNDSIVNTYTEWLKHRRPYNSDIEFDKKTLNEIRKENGFEEK